MNIIRKWVEGVAHKVVEDADLRRRKNLGVPESTVGVVCAAYFWEQKMVSAYEVREFLKMLGPNAHPLLGDVMRRLHLEVDAVVKEAEYKAAQKALKEAAK